MTMGNLSHLKEICRIFLVVSSDGHSLKDLFSFTATPEKRSAAQSMSEAFGFGTSGPCGIESSDFDPWWLSTCNITSLGRGEAIR